MSSSDLPVSEVTPVAGLRWWTFHQNNSGGYFITNDVVTEYVCIEAETVEEAISRAQALFADYSEYCECCGTRWSTYQSDEDGTESPEVYGESIYSVSPSYFRNECRLHYWDGSVEAYVFGTDPQKILT